MAKIFRCMMVLGAVFLFGFASSARAEAPKAQTQVPGYYHMQLGQFEVTALFDGALERDTKLLKQATPTDLKSANQ